MVTTLHSSSSPGPSTSVPASSLTSPAVKTSPEPTPDVLSARATPVLPEREQYEIMSLSPRREQILALINRYPGLNSAQLGELIKVTPAVASGVLCELIEKQLVHRRRSQPQADKKIPPYVYFYGRDLMSEGSAIQRRKKTDPEVKSTQSISATRRLKKTPRPAASSSTAPVSGSANTTRPLQETVRRAPPPPVSADPALFDEVLKEEGLDVELFAEQADTSAHHVESGEGAKSIEYTPNDRATEAPAGEEIVQVSFDAKPNSATVKQVKTVMTPAVEGLRPPPVAAAASTPVSASVSASVSTVSPIRRAAIAPVGTGVPGAIVSSLSEAIDELSDRLSDVVDGMAEHFSERLSTALSDLVVQAISEKLTAKLHNKTVARLEDAIDSMLPKEVASIEEDAAERMKLSSVVIVGLLPEQENMIKDEFKDCFRLRFWKDGNPKSLREISGNADHILTFVDKIGHKHEDAILASGRKPDRVTGGMSSLRKRLTEIYVNH